MRRVFIDGLVCALLFALGGRVFAQDGMSVPESVLRPSRSEAPRYPRDAVIGELGSGELRQEHLDFASSVLRALLLGREQSTIFSELPEGYARELILQIAGINAEKFRIGGGKEAADGALSFLFRFIGRDGTLSGELYFIQGANGFVLDDILVEEVPPELLNDDKDRAYNMSPYERFY